MNEKGEACETEEELEEEINQYYSKLFTTSSPNDGQDILQGMPRSITSAMNQLLTKLVEDIEIKTSLFTMYPQKAPGPNGMNPLFFPKFWYIVQSDICATVRDFFEHQRLLSL